MPNFNPNDLNNYFDQTFGKGSYNSGLQQAYKAGQVKQQASLAKSDFTSKLNKIKKAQTSTKKSYQDALNYWNQNKDTLNSKGAYRTEQEWLNDPMKRQQIKDAGFTQQDFIDAMYATETNGNSRSKREYNQQHKKGAYNQNLQPYDPYKDSGKSEFSITPMKSANTTTKKNSNERTGLLGFLDSTLGRISNVANEVAFGKGFNDTQNANYKKLAQDKLKKNPLDKIAKQNLQMQNTVTRPAKNNTEKASDFLGGTAGVMAPYTVGGAYGAADALLGKVGLNAIKSPLAKDLVRGIGAGAVAGTERGIAKNVASNQKISTKDIALESALAGGGDALFGAGARGLGRLLNKTKTPPPPTQELLGLPAPQLRLNAPQLQLSAPKPIQPSLDALMKVGKRPSGLTNPIPSMPKVMSQAITKGNLEKQGINFAQSGKYEPKARMDLTPIEHGNDPLKRPPEYWQKRYEDFAKFAKDKGYNSNNLSHDSIQELWSHFAKYDEPVNIDKVVELAYPKGYEAPPIPKVEPPKVENPLITALRNDPKINEKIKGFFPPVRPEPKVSRPATLNEIVQRIGELAPPKQPIAEPTPLNFRVPKGFNPNTPKNILNRSNTPLKGLEAISKGKAKSLKIDPITKPQDAHGYGLIDLKAEAKAKAQTEMDKLLANSDNWKDKAKPLLKRETMVRNFEDIMGKDAPKMKEKFLNGIGKGEADSTRFKNTLRTDVGKYGIKGYSKDSALAQMYGENKISLDELKANTKNWKNVVKLTEHLRSTYDELLPKMNKVLVDHGYDPVPYRKNYFPHQEDVTQFQKFLRDNVGIDFENNTLPTDINGLSSQFKPGKQFFRNALQRKGDQTAYDAVLGFDKYIEGISNVIHHTKNIKQLRELDTAIRNKYSGDTHLSNFASDLTEFTNNLAGKKSAVDRAIEDVVGRKAYNVLDTVRRKTGVNMVGANLSSALTNFIPLTHSLASTNKSAFVKGLVETMQNTLKDDGFINKSDFLTRRVGSDPLSSTIWEKTAHKSMVLMRGFDRFTSQVIVRGKYNELISKGVNEKQAMKQADEWAAKIMADRSKGSMPTLFNSKTLGLFSQFQLEVNNQISHLFKDLPRNSASKKELASRFSQILLYSYLFNNLYEKAVGRRPALDPIGIAFQAKTDYNNDHISNGTATKNLVGNVLNQLPFTSTLTGGRIPISASIPDVMGSIGGTADWKKEALKPLYYFAMPAAGGQMKKAYEGLSAMNLNPLNKQPIPGDYAPNGQLRYPIESNVSNTLKAALFGKSSLPETQKYYNDNQKQLSAKQTQMVERAADPMAMFNQISQKRSETTIMNKIKKLQSSNMNQTEKAKNLQHFMDQLKKLREGK